jgi:hypothetical protein
MQINDIALDQFQTKKYLKIQRYFKKKTIKIKRDYFLPRIS